MPRVKSSALLAAALFFLLISQNLAPASAEDEAFLYGVFPQWGELGVEVDILLNGEGFEMLPEITSVQIGNQRVPFEHYEVISDQYIRVLVVIPEQVETIGETQISFFFNDFRLDAYYVLTEPGDQEFNPVIRQYSPREGEADSEMALLFEGIRLSELGELGGLIIGDTAIPVIDHGLESDEALVVTIYLPFETPPGEMEIGIYFENYRFGDIFRVSRPPPEEPGPPEIHALTPQEGMADSEMELVMEGHGLLQLGDLWGVTIAGVDIPILDQRVESDELMVVALYLPPDLPPGETGISFFFDNFEFEESFFVRAAQPGPEEPRFPSVFALAPREGEVDSEVDLYLEGENFFDLGALLDVTVGGLDVPILYSDIESDVSMSVGVYLPEDTPRGEQRITFSFENSQFEEIFYISEPPDFLIWIVVVAVLSGAGGFLAGRLTSPRPNGKNGSNGEDGVDEPDWRPPDVRFEVGIDLGEVKVEVHGPSLTKDNDMHSEAEADYGNQSE